MAFGLSVCTAFFDIAYQSHLPRLVDEDRLVEANVALEATRTVTAAGGPGVGGALVAAVTAPVALAVDAVSFLASALLLSRIRRPDPRPAPVPGTRLRDEIAEGLRFVWRDRLLRGLTLTAAISNLCGTICTSMLLVLLAGDLGLSPFLCGLVFTAEAVGGFLGSLLTTRISARLGEARAMCASVVASGVLWLLALPFFQADGRYALACVLQGLGWTAFMTFKINSVVLRQRRTPAPLLGRVTATFRFLVWGCMPLGALAGGLLGQYAGVRTALWTGALGELMAVAPLLLVLRRARRDGQESAQGASAGRAGARAVGWWPGLGLSGSPRWPSPVCGGCRWRGPRRRSSWRWSRWRSAARDRWGGRVPARRRRRASRPRRA